MTVSAFLREGIRSKYAMMKWGNYPGFRSWIHDSVEHGDLSPSDAEEILRDFPDPSPVRPASLEEENGSEARLRDPPDIGPLGRLKNRGWLSPEQVAALHAEPEWLHALLDLDDTDVLEDVHQNAIHILGRCNNPSDWGENRRGLVYGMVQSGKTANMIDLIHVARQVGYRLFIILAGDKTSLRDQTQGRINRAFRLSYGSNPESRVHSPTWDRDYRHAGGGYMENFRYLDLSRGESWSTIIVIKKQKDHLTELTNHIGMLKARMREDGAEFGEAYPALILDDEADYASQNTDVYGFGNTIHNELVALRQAIPRNTYVGYTATPQACLSADTEDSVGYPKHFIWLLEPFMDEKDGGFTPRSYLGAWEVFWDYSRWLVHDIGRDEWPHHERDPRGKYGGIYVPDLDARKRGHLIDDERLYEVETRFLDEVLRGTRIGITAIHRALIDYMIGCGVRWWRFWKEQGEPELPTTKWIEDRYPYHAAMIHFSVKQENQERVRQIVQAQWEEAVRAKNGYDPTTSPPNDIFRDRLRLQKERTECLLRGRMPPWEELSYLIDRCIEITSKPIADPASPMYAPYEGEPFVYLLNSSDVGMELAYADHVDPEIRTKKASIVVGGQILSRGLTVEGLSVSVFARTAQMPLGDATLQMGRWFGHRMGNIDLVAVHLQRQVRDLMKELADADRYLRLQIKDSIYHENPPDRILIELRNSPFFRVTSPSKSAFLKDDGGNVAFSGKRAILEQPSFKADDILHNRKVLGQFESSHTGQPVFGRAQLYRDVNPDDVIRLMTSFLCDPDASQVSFQKYADYLKDWRDGDDLPRLPRINVAVMTNRKMERQRITEEGRPVSAEEARTTVTDRFGSITGGVGDDGAYKGDAFLDKDPGWHLRTPHPDRVRPAGDDILIVFYSLKPNYVCKQLWDSTRTTPDHPEGGWRDERVFLQPGDRFYVDTQGRPEEEYSVTTFAAWTPVGGPLYGVKVNRLIRVTDIVQRGREQLGAEAIP